MYVVTFNIKYMSEKSYYYKKIIIKIDFSQVKLKGGYHQPAYLHKKELHTAEKTICSPFLSFYRGAGQSGISLAGHSALNIYYISVFLSLVIRSPTAVLGSFPSNRTLYASLVMGMDTCSLFASS